MLKAAYGHDEINSLDPKALKTTMTDLVGQYPSMYRNDLSILDMGRDKGGEVVRYLENLGINRTDAATYTALMADKGIDTAMDVLRLTPHQLDEYGMRAVHKQKVQKAIKTMKDRLKRTNADEDGLDLPLPVEMWSHMSELTHDQGEAVFSDLTEASRRDMLRAISQKEQLVKKYQHENEFRDDFLYK